MIKDTIAVSLNRSGITYSNIIETKDIQIDGFSIEIYFNLMNDILNNNKGKYKIDCNSCKCTIQFNMKIAGYVPIEYNFSLTLTPTEKVTDVKILNYQIYLLKVENRKMQRRFSELMVKYEECSNMVDTMTHEFKSKLDTLECRQREKDEESSTMTRESREFQNRLDTLEFVQKLDLGLTLNPNPPYSFMSVGDNDLSRYECLLSKKPINYTVNNNKIYTFQIKK